MALTASGSVRMGSSFEILNWVRLTAVSDIFFKYTSAMVKRFPMASLPPVIAFADSISLFTLLRFFSSCIAKFFAAGFKMRFFLLRKCFCVITKPGSTTSLCFAM